MPTWVWVFLVVNTAWGWIGGVLIRAGHLRRIAWNLYFNPGQARPTRNSPFAMIPAACVFTTFLVFALLVRAGWNPTVPLALAFLLLFVAFGVWAVVVSFWPPEFLKPRWVREEERPMRVIFLGRTPGVETFAAATGRRGHEVCVVERSPGGFQMPDADPRSAVVVATFGHDDREAVRAALGTEAGYVGLVAQGHRAAAVLRELRESGVGAEQVARVRVPPVVAALDLNHPRVGELATVALLTDLRLFAARSRARQRRLDLRNR